MTTSAVPATSAGLDFPLPPRGAIRRAARRLLDAVAVAQMTRALHMFPDSRLAALGIARGDIPAHAARMVARG